MCVFEGGVRVVRGGTFCGDVVLFTERWCFFLRGSARTYAHVQPSSANNTRRLSTRGTQRRCVARPAKHQSYLDLLKVS